MLVKELLSGHVDYLSKIVYNTQILLSQKVKETVLSRYKKLTKQTKSYFRFMGPQPITLNKDNLKIAHPDSIVKQYCVTEKADGERYELFIFDKKGYLINAKQSVIEIPLNFEKFKGEWLFDGEYITRDKQNRPIKLFKAFDVYYAGNTTPQPIYQYPFIGENPTDISRYDVLNTLEDLLYLDVSQPEWTPEYESDFDDYYNPHTFEISAKEYEFGYQKSALDGYWVKKIKGVDVKWKQGTPLPVDYKDWKRVKKAKWVSEENNDKDLYLIFEASANILSRIESDYYDYKTDGLIYLPMRLSVKAQVEGTTNKNIGGTWTKNFKWKPPEENTIDFKVKVEKTSYKGVIKDKIYPMSRTNEDGTNEIIQYKKVSLIVGYDSKQDDKLDYCMMILDNQSNKKESLKEIVFDPPNLGNSDYRQTDLMLTNGRMLCDNINQDEIKDGDIVEMLFDPEAENGMYWKPVRVRSDKLNPQFFTAANNVWNTVMDPVTESMIRGKISLNEIKSPLDDGSYYIKDKYDLDIQDSLRKLHNYIKFQLIVGLGSTFTKRSRY